MSKWGWAARIGGFAAAPFTAGYSIPAGLAAGGAIERKQAANDGPQGGGDPNGLDPDNAESGFLSQLQQQGQSLAAQGKAFGDQSGQAMQPALDYLRNLLTGNGAMDATKQQRGQVIDQYDTARRAISQFGARGGGTTSALAESRFSQAESLSDITSSAQRDAAGDLSQIGVQLASLGLSAEQLKSQNLDTIIQSVLAREGLDVARRGQNMGLLGDVGETIGTLVGLWMGRDKGGAGGGGGAPGGPTIGRG